eukprot:Rmarinus@m.28126
MPVDTDELIQSLEDNAIELTDDAKHFLADLIRKEEEREIYEATTMQNPDAPHTSERVQKKNRWAYLQENVEIQKEKKYKKAPKLAYLMHMQKKREEEAKQEEEVLGDSSPLFKSSKSIASSLSGGESPSMSRKRTYRPGSIAHRTSAVAASPKDEETAMLVGYIKQFTQDNGRPPKEEEWKEAMTWFAKQKAEKRAREAEVAADLAKATKAEETPSLDTSSPSTPDIAASRPLLSFGTLSSPLHLVEEMDPACNMMVPKMRRVPVADKAAEETPAPTFVIPDRSQFAFQAPKEDEKKRSTSSSDDENKEKGARSGTDKSHLSKTRRSARAEPAGRMPSSKQPFRRAVVRVQKKQSPGSFGEDTYDTVPVMLDKRMTIEREKARKEGVWRSTATSVRTEYVGTWGYQAPTSRVVTKTVPRNKKAWKIGRGYTIGNDYVGGLGASDPNFWNRIDHSTETNANRPPWRPAPVSAGSMFLRMSCLSQGEPFTEGDDTYVPVDYGSATVWVPPSPMKPGVSGPAPLSNEVHTPGKPTQEEIQAAKQAEEARIRANVQKMKALEEYYRTARPPRVTGTVPLMIQSLRRDVQQFRPEWERGQRLPQPVPPQSKRSVASDSQRSPIRPCYADGSDPNITHTLKLKETPIRQSTRIVVHLATANLVPPEGDGTDPLTGGRTGEFPDPYAAPTLPAFVSRNTSHEDMKPVLPTSSHPGLGRPTTVPHHELCRESQHPPLTVERRPYTSDGRTGPPSASVGPYPSHTDTDTRPLHPTGTSTAGHASEIEVLAAYKPPRRRAAPSSARELRGPRPTTSPRHHPPHSARRPRRHTQAHPGARVRTHDHTAMSMAGSLDCGGVDDGDDGTGGLGKTAPTEHGEVADGGVGALRSAAAVKRMLDFESNPMKSFSSMWRSPSPSSDGSASDPDIPQLHPLEETHEGDVRYVQPSPRLGSARYRRCSSLRGPRDPGRPRSNTWLPAENRIALHAWYDAHHDAICFGSLSLRNPPLEILWTNIDVFINAKERLVYLYDRSVPDEVSGGLPVSIVSLGLWCSIARVRMRTNGSHAPAQRLEAEHFSQSPPRQANSASLHKARRNAALRLLVPGKTAAAVEADLNRSESPLLILDGQDPRRRALFSNTAWEKLSGSILNHATDVFRGVSKKPPAEVPEDVVCKERAAGARSEACDPSADPKGLASGADVLGPSRSGLFDSYLPHRLRRATEGSLPSPWSATVPAQELSGSSDSTLTRPRAPDASSKPARVSAVSSNPRVVSLSSLRGSWMSQHGSWTSPRSCPRPRPYTAGNVPPLTRPIPGSNPSLVARSPRKSLVSLCPQSRPSTAGNAPPLTRPIPAGSTPSLGRSDERSPRKSMASLCDQDRMGRVRSPPTQRVNGGEESRGLDEEFRATGCVKHSALPFFASPTAAPEIVQLIVGMLSNGGDAFQAVLQCCNWDEDVFCVRLTMVPYYCGDRVVLWVADASSYPLCGAKAIHSRRREYNRPSRQSDWQFWVGSLLGGAPSPSLHRRRMSQPGLARHVCSPHVPTKSQPHLVSIPSAPSEGEEGLGHHLAEGLPGKSLPDEDTRPPLKAEESMDSAIQALDSYPSMSTSPVAKNLFRSSAPSSESCDNPQALSRASDTEVGAGQDQGQGVSVRGDGSEPPSLSRDASESGLGAPSHEDVDGRLGDDRTVSSVHGERVNSVDPENGNHADGVYGNIDGDSSHTFDGGCAAEAGSREHAGSGTPGNIDDEHLNSSRAEHGTENADDSGSHEAGVDRRESNMDGDALTDYYSRDAEPGAKDDANGLATSGVVDGSSKKITPDADGHPQEVDASTHSDSSPKPLGAIGVSADVPLDSVASDDWTVRLRKRVHDEYFADDQNKMNRPHTSGVDPATRPSLLADASLDEEMVLSKTHPGTQSFVTHESLDKWAPCTNLASLVQECLFRLLGVSSGARIRISGEEHEGKL